MIVGDGFSPRDSGQDIFISPAKTGDDVRLDATN
jgi:hypothetical protein